MIKKTVFLSLSLVTIVFLAGFFALGSESQSLSCSACDIGVVDKKPREGFDVEITFKNSGTSKGTWSVNIAFEGDVWILEDYLHSRPNLPHLFLFKFQYVYAIEVDSAFCRLYQSENTVASRCFSTSALSN